jgi:hypothetical protein
MQRGKRLIGYKCIACGRAWTESSDDPEATPLKR